MLQKFLENFEEMLPWYNMQTDRCCTLKPKIIATKGLTYEINIQRVK